jgi:hypothetical protein
MMFHRLVFLKAAILTAVLASEKAEFRSEICDRIDLIASSVALETKAEELGRTLCSNL